MLTEARKRLDELAKEDGFDLEGSVIILGVARRVGELLIDTFRAADIRGTGGAERCAATIDSWELLALDLIELAMKD